MADAVSTEARDKFRDAYRMARIAFRGRRQALLLDLQLEPDYSPNCRRCNASVAITRKVSAAVGLGDELSLYSQAVRIAFGERCERQPRMPPALDFEGWAEWREWASQVRKVA